MKRTAKYGLTVRTKAYMYLISRTRTTAEDAAERRSRDKTLVVMARAAGDEPVVVRGFRPRKNCIF